MNELFDICVHLLEWFARLVGITYKEANIYIFVIGYPLLLLTLVLGYKIKIRSLKKQIQEGEKFKIAQRDWQTADLKKQQDNVFHFE